MKTKLVLLILSGIALFPACGEVKPEPVKLNSDNCDYCKMTIADAKFVAEIVTPKGRVYKFDDVSCLLGYHNENPNNDGVKLYVANFKQPEQFLLVGDAIFVKGEEINSPMGGNMAAFNDSKSAEQFASPRSAQIVLWNDIKR